MELEEVKAWDEGRELGMVIQLQRPQSLKAFIPLSLSPEV